MITGIIIAATAILLLIILICMGYVSAPPNKAIIITGLGKQRTLIGRAAGNAIGQELTDTKTTPTPTGNLAN